MKKIMSFVALAASLSLLTASSCNFCCKKSEPAAEAAVVEENKEAAVESKEMAAAATDVQVAENAQTEAANDVATA